MAVGVLAWPVHGSGVPDDYQQGATVRIMFVHVPAAWMALLLIVSYFLPALWRWYCAIHWVIWQPARRTGGRGFHACRFGHGRAVGQPMWGTWWVWDARLTSVLVLLFIYLGYIALWEAIDDYGRAARATSILAVVGLQCADCKIFRRLVEHLAPTGQRVAFPAARPACRFSLSAFW